MLTEDTAPAWLPDRADLSDWGVTRDEARALLLRQMCPACGQGPWKSPLTHVAKKHGIDRVTMRDACGLTVTEAVADADLSARYAERGKGMDMSLVNQAGKPRRKQRWTQAGLDTQRATLRAWEDADPKAAAEQRRIAAEASKTEGARRRQGGSLRAFYEAMTDEERAAAFAHLPHDSETQRAKSLSGWEKRGRRPCGTVAAYKRGCRCDSCGAAKKASRQ